jgi:hypothetical protein
LDAKVFKLSIGPTNSIVSVFSGYRDFVHSAIIAEIVF